MSDERTVSLFELERLLAYERRAENVKRFARERIARCRQTEAKFSAIRPGRSPRAGPPQSLVEAWTERQTLEGVLWLLGEASP